MRMAAVARSRRRGAGGVVALLLLVGFAGPVGADDLELAKKSQNPIANLIALPLENNLRGNSGSRNALEYDLTLKPVYPVELTPKLLMINRVIASLIHQGRRRPGEDTETGFGDINYQAFFSPQTGKVIWGVGPSLFIPTASDDRLGTGKWSLGPAAVVLAKPGPWLVGTLVQHAWSVGGKSNRNSVNATSLQYFVNYNFEAGFYFTSNPTIVADWDANSRSRWTVPFGGGLGKIFRLGKQPVDLRGRFFYNVVKPDPAPPWQAQIEVKLLFPK